MSLTRKINLALFAARYHEVTRKKLAHIFHRDRAGRPAGFPALLRFFLFHGCNLRCSMCGQWRRKSTGMEKNEKGFIPIGKLKEIIDGARPYMPEVYVWGGEPTLHPDFIEFICYVKKSGMVCTVNTNGTTLKRLAAGIIGAGVDSVDISLDGTEEVHDRVRGVKGTYGKVMEGLDELERVRRGKKPLVKAVITLSGENLGSVEALLAELEKNPAVHLSIIQLGWYVTAQAGERYESRLGRDFGIQAASWRGFEDNQTRERAREAGELIKRIKGGGYRKPVLFFPDLKDGQVETYYADHSDRVGRKRCGAIFREVDIRPDGDVVICGDFPDITVGNIYRQTIREIWTGDTLRDFRENLEKNGLFAICTRCCGFFR